MKKSNKLTYSIIAALLFSGPILHQLDLIPDNMAIKINEDCMDSSESVSDCSLLIQALSFLWPTHVIEENYNHGAWLHTETYGFVLVKNGQKEIVMEKHKCCSDFDNVCYLCYEVPIVNGKRHGIGKEYYWNGQLWEEIPYVNGKEHGVEKVYDKNGQLLGENLYQNGKGQGIIKTYYSNGQLYSEIPYVNGEKHGVKKEYYENGQLREEIPYENGEIHGVVKWYHDNGQLKSEIPYEYGNRHGVEKVYDENGQLKSERFY